MPVKRDMLARKTGNVCIEHRAVAHSRATYFVYAIDGCPQVFQLDHMRPGQPVEIDVDADPAANIWNARRISAIILNGEPLDRNSLLHLKK